MSFQFDDLVYTWSIEGFVLVFGLGTVMGTIIAVTNHRVMATHVYWQLAGGIVFFIPLTILRAIQEFDFWERPLGLLAFWVTYIIGMYLGGLLLERWKLR